MSLSLRPLRSIWQAAFDPFSSGRTLCARISCFDLRFNGLIVCRIPRGRGSCQEEDDDGSRFLKHPYIRVISVSMHTEDLGGKVREGALVFLQEEKIGKCLVSPDLAGL